MIMAISKILIFATFLGSTLFVIGQTDNKTKLIVQISPVYESGLVQYDPDSYLLVSRNLHENFRKDLFFALMSKKKFQKQSDLIDSISKDFKIYSIIFDSTQKQIQKVINDRNNFGDSFLIPLVSEVSGVKAYLVTLFAKQIKNLHYKIIKSDCGMHWEDCEVEISKIKF
jgi:hypothetical protein